MTMYNISVRFRDGGDLSRLLPLLMWALVAGMLTAAPLRAQQAPDATVLPMNERLRLRDLPAFSGETLALLESFAPLTIIGRTADGWWLHVRTADDVQGWVVSEFVRTTMDVSAVPITADLDALAQPYPLAPAVVRRMQETAARGAEQGARPGVFAKVGDSITAAPHFLRPIGAGIYTLGDFQHLQATIDYYRVDLGDGVTPFERVSLAAGVGWTAPAVLDPRYADPQQCAPGETPLECEYRLIQPQVALIMLGTNDVSRLNVSVYQGNLEEIVAISLERGVIPVISTIPYQEQHEDAVYAFNRAVQDTAEKLIVPFWDLFSELAGLRDAGLDMDGVHLSIPPRGYKGAADFRPHNLYYGYVIRNLGALRQLEAVRQALAGAVTDGIEAGMRPDVSAGGSAA